MNSPDILLTADNNHSLSRIGVHQTSSLSSIILAAVKHTLLKLVCHVAGLTPGRHHAWSCCNILID